MSKNQIGNWKINNVELSYRVYGTKNRKTSTTKSLLENTYTEKPKPIRRKSILNSSSNETTKIDICVEQSFPNDQINVRNHVIQKGVALQTQTQIASTQTIGYWYPKPLLSNGKPHSQHSISADWCRSGSDCISRGVETDNYPTSHTDQMFGRFTKRTGNDSKQSTEGVTGIAHNASFGGGDEQVLSSTVYTVASDDSFSKIAKEPVTKRESPGREKNKHLLNEPSFISEQRSYIIARTEVEKKSKKDKSEKSGTPREKRKKKRKTGSKSSKKSSGSEGSKKCCGSKKHNGYDDEDYYKRSKEKSKTPKDQKSPKDHGVDLSSNTTKKKKTKEPKTGKDSGKNKRERDQLDKQKDDDLHVTEDLGPISTEKLKMLEYDEKDSNDPLRKDRNSQDHKDELKPKKEKKEHKDAHKKAKRSTPEAPKRIKKDNQKRAQSTMKENTSTNQDQDKGNSKHSGVVFDPNINKDRQSTVKKTKSKSRETKPIPKKAQRSFKFSTFFSRNKSQDPATKTAYSPPKITAAPSNTKTEVFDDIKEEKLQKNVSTTIEKELVINSKDEGTDAIKNSKDASTDINLSKIEIDNSHKKTVNFKDASTEADSTDKSPKILVSFKEQNDRYNQRPDPDIQEDEILDQAQEYSSNDNMKLYRTKKETEIESSLERRQYFHESCTAAVELNRYCDENCTYVPKPPRRRRRLLSRILCCCYF